MEKEKLFVDGEEALLGRLASFAAKQTLQGKEIVIVNSDKVIISGNHNDIINKYKRKREMGGSSQKGFILHSVEYKILKRTIKGMLPKNTRGKEALARVKCYNSIPKEFENEKMIKGKSKELKNVTLKKVVGEIK